jgi:hypothetical protein
VAERLDLPKVKVMIPGEATELAFTLWVMSPEGSDSTELAVPIEPGPRDRLPSDVCADAGDDQTGLVGHQISLNGRRSAPRGRLYFRWIQVEGPRLDELSQEGGFCTFTPMVPGVYRFVLVVSDGGPISGPDDVRVTVKAGGPQPERVRSARPVAAVEASGSAASVSVDVQAREALLSLPGGPARATALAEAFQGVADRMALYESYFTLQDEMARRLDVLLPSEPGVREQWNRRLFGPLSQRISEAVGPEGLDLRRPESLTAAMSAGQKARLKDVFLAISRGFRATVLAEPPGPSESDR